MVPLHQELINSGPNGHIRPVDRHLGLPFAQSTPQPGSHGENLVDDHVCTEERSFSGGKVLTYSSNTGVLTSRPSSAGSVYTKVSPTQEHCGRKKQSVDMLRRVILNRCTATGAAASRIPFRAAMLQSSTERTWLEAILKSPAPDLVLQRAPSE